MLKKLLITLSLIIFLITNVFSQEDSIYIPRNYLKAVAKGTRSLDGMPGKNYWQNTADYNLKIKVNPKTRLLTGSEEIIYYNNSPDTLKRMVIRLYPDFYKKGNNRDEKIDAADENDGVKISLLKIGEETFDIATSAKIETEGTNLIIKVKPIAPKSTVTIYVNWSYEINKGSPVRTGMIDESSAFIGYCFPRIAVYDDLDGWDYSEYLGKDESYFGYGNFNAEVTVPKNYVVWATGTLLNGKEVLSDKVYYTLEQAKNVDVITNIIDANDVAQKNLTAKNKWNTFKFKATNVSDFAFAFSDHFLWQASSIHLTNVIKRDRILVSAVFNKEHKDYFETAKVARKTVEVMSYNFPGYPYPYEHMTVVDGPEQMEYPMMCNDNDLPFKDMVELTTHEIMHTYFPFMMGTNQTKYGWMDESWATIGEWITSPMIYGDTLVDEYGIWDVNTLSGTEKDVPIIVNTNHITDRTQFINSYAKPAFALLYLRDWLGEQEFKRLTTHYMDTWKGKHHAPWDLFNFFSTSTEKNLNWFWKRWFYDWGYPDLAIQSVEKVEHDEVVTIISKGNKPVPVNLFITYKDGTTEKMHSGCNVWMSTNSVIYRLQRVKEIKSLKLGDIHDVDVNKKDNVWEAE